MGRPVVHFEIGGSHLDELQRFRHALFDWEFDAGRAPNYRLVWREGNTSAAGAGIGGGVGMAPNGTAGHVTFYVEVSDVETALGTAERLGGSRLFGPDSVTQDCELGIFADPQGHLIGLVSHAD